MTDSKVVQLPKRSELDEQFISLEMQQKQIQEQKKLIQEQYK
tara:strand:- start:178 stop:303 length:126 start_codon:yes stop_codon:yes gene_type:complete